MEHTLLLVDDENDILQPMKMLLEGQYRVLTALGGEEALALMEQERVDLIIADQRMPGMSGVDLLARVRTFYPRVVRLILTAYTDVNAMIRAINEGQVYRYILKPWTVDDMHLTIRQALDWKRLRDSNGQLVADLAGALTDLRERNRQLERAQQTIVRQEKLAAVGRFAAEMAHEINNHLQIISSLNSSLSLSRKMEFKQLKELEAQVVMLGEISLDIRDFARGATLPFSPTRVNPQWPVGEVVRACQHHPAFHRLGLRLEAGTLAPWTLDPRQIKHLLLNLLKNAARASQEGQEIVVRLETGEEELVIQVIDHGVGIPLPMRQQIWEPFFTTSQDNGTGLGLSICRQVVELHQGTIACDDTPGGGTTFTVRVPRGLVGEPTP